MVTLHEKIRIDPIRTAAFLEVRRVERLGQQHPWTDDLIRSELENPNAFHFGAYCTTPTVLVAFILARTIFDEVHIHHVCTHPDFRRNGIARRLLDHILATARMMGSKKAFLEVAAPNVAAVALYMKAGFTRDSVRKKYYSNGDDALVMSMSLHD